MSTITWERAKETCKIGQGAECCRFLTVDGDGPFCAKSDESLVRQINARRSSMTAKANRCSGPPKFKPLDQEQEATHGRA